MKDTENISVSFKPSLDQINKIKEWLIEENNESGEGFYCNWRAIKSSFQNNEMAVISFGEECVGFVIWNKTSELSATIDIAEIKPTHRIKGLGKLLVLEVLKKFKSKGIVVVDLQCVPATSEIIWRKLGFIDFPTDSEDYKYDEKWLYKTLVPVSEDGIYTNDSEYIELWNNEPYRARNIKPTLFWKLDFVEETRRLRKVIIHPCNRDWRIVWKKEGAIFFDEKVKRFGEEIYFGKYLIIRKIPPTVVRL